MECCPRPTALTTIPTTTCAVTFDQIVKFAVQRAGTPFATLTALKTLASWTALTAETDDTKIIVSPFVNGLVIPPSEADVEGGGTNETLFGFENLKGEKPVTVTAQIWNISSATYLALKKLSCESNPSLSNGVVFYLFNKNKEIIHTSTFTGIPAYNFRISTPGSEGYNAATKYNISFTLASDWADDILITRPTDFNPFQDL